MNSIRLVVLSGLLALFPVISFSQSYASFLITDSLKRNANAVVRESISVLEVQSESKASLKVFKAVTVLNKEGEESGLLVLPYDPQALPEDIHIILYDHLGKQLKKVKSSEIVDHSFVDDGTMYSDDRVKFYMPIVNQYPYTVTFEYSLQYKGCFRLPTFLPVNDFGLSVERSSFTLMTKQGLPVRTHELNFDSSTCSVVRSEQSIVWTVKDFKAVKKEPLSGDIGTIAPKVLISPTSFEYDGSRGDLSSWKSMGKWTSDLLAGRDKLPPSTSLLIHQMTDTIHGKLEKARRLYEYMQSKVRYVGIQLGIGSFQPFTAESVDKLGYGDCKALSNYYIAMLKEAGINALYAITMMEEGKVFFIDYFPANSYFNHVIVCIPMQNDSVWVECTSNYVPFGYIGEGVAGHPSLLVTTDGGKLVYIPKPPADENRMTECSHMKIQPDGSASLDIHKIYEGLSLHYGLGQYSKNKKEQEEGLYEGLGMNDIIISNYHYTYNSLIPASVILDAELSCNKFGSINGSRMFLPVLLPGNMTHPPDNVENRELPFYLNASYSKVDTLVYEIPSAYKIESLPPSFNSVSKFGEYTILVRADGNTIMIIQHSSLFEGAFPPEEYARFMEYMHGIQKAEKQKILLKLV